MPAKKIQADKLPRIGPNEVFPRVGESAERLKAIIPVFGEKIIKALIESIAEGQIKQGELELISLYEPKQKVRASFTGAAGDRDIKITLSGDWKKLKDINLDNPIFCPVRGMIYRKRNPSEKEPIAAEGQVIEPNGAICAISQGKNNIWYLQLPADKFPKGGILTKFVVSDGHEAEKDEVICYIKKVE